MTETSLYPQRFELSKATLYDWYEAIAEDAPLVGPSGKMLMDYEAASLIEEHLDLYTPFDVSINAPYILICPAPDAEVPIEIISLKLFIDLDKITHIGDNYIINCKDIVPLCAVDEDDRDLFAIEFLNYILEIGNIENDYSNIIQDTLTFEEFAKKIRTLCDLHDGTEIYVATERRQIAIAFDRYVDSARDTVGKCLNLDKEIFVEVSNPYSTVLVIDCEKVYLATMHYDKVDAEWFY